MKPRPARPQARCHVPERASGVKAPSGGFLCIAEAAKPFGLWGSGCNLVPVEIWERGLGSHGLLLRGCRAVLFVCGGTPTHPFVNTPARAAVVQIRGGLTPMVFCDRLAGKGRLNHPNARLAEPSPHGTSDWPCGRGPLPCGRADATVSSISSSVCYLRGFPQGLVVVQ